jgi:hypothetical protein
VKGDDGIEDGTHGWDAFVNDRFVTRLRSGDMDVADSRLDPLWKELGIDINFEWD